MLASSIGWILTVSGLITALAIGCLIIYSAYDPAIRVPVLIAAWRTRFSSLGARLEPSAHWTFIAQYLDGNTAVGPDSSGEDQFL